MFAGHFGLAAGVKARAPYVPLWALMASTQLLDLVFLVLLLFGVESYSPVNSARPNAYGGLLIHAWYSHSLVGALLLAVVAGLLARAFWGRRAAPVIGGVVFSHWILDLLVHRPDLPILPGNAGNLPLLGFGLWQMPAVSAALEAVLVLGGGFLYYRAALRLPAPSIRSSQTYRTRAFTAGLVTLVLMILALVTDVLGLG